MLLTCHISFYVVLYLTISINVYLHFGIATILPSSWHYLPSHHFSPTSSLDPPTAHKPPSVQIRCLGAQEVLVALAVQQALYLLLVSQLQMKEPAVSLGAGRGVYCR